MRQRMAAIARASRTSLPRARHANRRASIANTQEMQGMHCKKAVQHFAHGCWAMAAEPRAAPDAMEACASPNPAREARRALEVAWERLGGETSKERAHGNTPFLSAPPRWQAFQIWVARMKMQLLYGEGRKLAAKQ